MPATPGRLLQSRIYLLLALSRDSVSPSVCWFRMVDRGGASEGTAGGREAPRVAAGRAVQLNHPVTLRASRSDAAVKIPSSLKIHHL